MTILFQIIAAVAIVLSGFLLFRGSGARHQAVRRLLMAAFVVAAAASVFVPQLWTGVANFLGIGRGADLLLYFMVLIFVVFVATTYRRFRQFELQHSELARQMALLKARQDGEGGSPAGEDRPRETP
ncbi:MAG: DUF2304 domain-containing protein [Salinibacterium sp.]|nr:DUF2304 domain-containing protein [Salinibacterium sp.]MBF0673471.1 DUF2304 domain-containing protein [Salinibacterium sp.]